MKLSIIEEFLSQKSYAVIGVSSNKRKFGSMIYKDLKANRENYRKCYKIRD